MDWAGSLTGEQGSFRVEDEHSTGFKPQWVLSLAVGSAIGWGAFILPYGWIKSGGLWGSIAGFILGGIMVAVVGLSYGTAVRSMPVSGGSVAYATVGFGKIPGLIAGWSLALGYGSIVALNASAATLVFRQIFPGVFNTFSLYSIAGWEIYLPEVALATGVLVGGAYLNSKGATLSGRFQFGCVLVMLGAVCLLGFLSLQFWLANGHLLPEAIPESASTAGAIGTILAIVPWAYVGFDTIPQLAGEFDFPAQRARRLLFWGVLGATFFYVAMILTTAFVVGNSVEAYEQSAWPVADAISTTLGNKGEILLIVAVSAGVLTGLNGFYTATSRVLQAMGRAYFLPRSFARVDPRSGSPTFAVWTVCALCLITPWFGRASLGWIVEMSSVGVTVSYFFTCMFALRVAAHDKTKTGFLNRMPAILGVAFSIIFLLQLIVPGSPGSLAPQAFFALSIWVLIACGLCILRYKAISNAPRNAVLHGEK